MTRPTEDLTAVHHLVAGVLPRLDRALEVLHGQLGGYPARVPGAEPPDHHTETCDCGPDVDCDHNVALTGPERIMAEAEAGRIDEARRRIRRTEHLIRTMRALTHELDEIVNDAAPDAVPTKAEDERAVAGQAPPGYCRSCYRHRGEKVPVAKRYSGELQLCYWCGNWRATHGGQLPPLELVRHHLAGGVVTASLAARYLRDDVTTRPRTSRNNRKKRARAERVAEAEERRRKRLGLG